MQITDKVFCRELADMLAVKGVEDVVLSPGSRNAPLILAVTRHPVLNYRVVIDERSAAFIALGIASQSRKPVAIVCTSGSAMLNYAPAIAEAYYREVPLIVITADRPQPWIDQDDSQTIRQPGALSHIVKQSIDVPVETGDPTQMWMVNRMLNDAMSAAIEGRQGPVHINVQIDLPLTNTVKYDYFGKPREVKVTTPSMTLPVALVRSLAKSLQAPRKILIVCGFMPPSQKVSRAISRLAKLPNVAVMTEAQANVHASGCIRNMDRVLASLDADTRAELAPDVVITVGGSLVSRYIRGWLRKLPALEHWHVGVRDMSVDAFMHMTRRIEITPESFMSQLASAMQPNVKLQSDYASLWHSADRRAQELHEQYMQNLGWCDLSAMAMLMHRLPADCNLQAGNGTAVRYVQLLDYTKLHRIDSNRGVSGIDGCTSTAIGAAMAYKAAPTVLISGDMSMQYDIGALATNDIPDRLRIAVLNNSGGTIFHFLKAIDALPEVDECFAARVNLPLEQLAAAYGFRYLRATNEAELNKILPEFLADKKVILDIQTDGRSSAGALNEYFKFLSQK